MANHPPYEISQQELELIEAYLSKQLDAGTQQQLEVRMQSDSLFRLKVEEVRNLITGIEEASLESKLHSFHAAFEQSRAAVSGAPSKVIPVYRRWWAAAAVLLLAAVTTWVLWPKASKNERLFMAYFTPDIGLPVAMGSADSASYLFYDGMVSYKEEKYAAAIQKWQGLAKTGVPSDTLQYYMAMALLNQGQNPETEKLLMPLADKPDTPYYEEANWYLALIRLRNGDRPNAIRLLKKIPDREEARKLLAELEQ